MSKSKHKPAQKILFFYCYTCKDYELKTSLHYRAQQQRFAIGTELPAHREKIEVTLQRLTI